jgi:hypothetical protein
MKFYILFKNLAKSIKGNHPDKNEDLKNEDKIQLIINDILSL